jgi:hypothetical protein
MKMTRHGQTKIARLLHIFNQKRRTGVAGAR